LRYLGRSANGSGSNNRGQPWNLVLPAVFALVSGRNLVDGLLDPRYFGAHAVVYTDAARAWLSGGDPWRVGPPNVIFAGPPPMLVPFVPFVWLPVDLIRLIWVLGTAVLAIWTLRRLRLPAYWLAFPPIFLAIELGHPEVLILWLVVFGGTAGGLAPLIKPYAGLALLAERRWRAIAFGLLVFLATFPILPWPLFVADLSQIGATIVRQNVGDSAFGQPLLVAIAVIALGSLGLRRALWLTAPVLWPYQQPIYKVVSVPMMSPLIAAFWAIPVPGATLTGVVLEAILLQLARRRPLPGWLQAGLGPAATWPGAEPATAGGLALDPPAAAMAPASEGSTVGR
jgi:hypothetical protein